MKFLTTGFTDTKSIDPWILTLKKNTVTHYFVGWMHTYSKVFDRLDLDDMGYLGGNWTALSQKSKFSAR